nr:proline-rich receptor-like protein kinase PERK2 [Aegilops tauschii subsp. strangulata]
MAAPPPHRRRPARPPRPVRRRLPARSPRLPRLLRAARPDPPSRRPSAAASSSAAAPLLRPRPPPTAVRRSSRAPPPAPPPVPAAPPSTPCFPSLDPVPSKPGDLPRVLSGELPCLGSAVSKFAEMSEQSDSQNRSEEQVQMSEGSDPSSTSGDGSRSTPSNLPKAEEEEDDSLVLRKLKPKIPDHNDAHPVAEDMHIRKDAGLRLWRQSDPYAVRRRTTVDYRFHTKEQQDFYDTILLDKKPNELINSKMGTGTYLLDKEHLPLHPNFEDNTVVMNEEDPTSVQAQKRRAKAKAEKAAKMPSVEEASQVFMKSKEDKLGYLIHS